MPQETIDDVIGQESIRIPNLAMVSRSIPLTEKIILLYSASGGAVAIGQEDAALLLGICSGGVAGTYALFSAIDFVQKHRSRKVDFEETFGVDIRNLSEMSIDARHAEIATLTERLNDEFSPRTYTTRETAEAANESITDYLADFTGQRVETSNKVRKFSLVKLLMPFALAGTDALSGDIAIYRDTGVFEGHVIGHELIHRKGYSGELVAQALAYLALDASGDPELVQSTNCERLHSQYRATHNNRPQRREAVEASELRPELKRDFLALSVDPNMYEHAISAVTKSMYWAKMKLTGQKGFEDYHKGFTNFLHAIGKTA